MVIESQWNYCLNYAEEETGAQSVVGTVMARGEGACDPRWVVRCILRGFDWPSVGRYCMLTWLEPRVVHNLIQTSAEEWEHA